MKAKGETEEKMEHIENTNVPDVSKVMYSGNYVPTMENFPASHWK